MEDKILAGIQIARILIGIGMEVAAGIKAIFGADALTDEQINSIEQAAMNDDDKRIARRIAEQNPQP